MYGKVMMSAIATSFVVLGAGSPSHAQGCAAKLGAQPKPAEIIACIASQEAEIEQLRAAVLPKGAVAFFDATRTCPSGWRTKDEALGRYIVGTNLPDSVGQRVGTSLKDRENRTVGKHSHDYLTYSAGGRGPGLGWDSSGNGAERKKPEAVTSPAGDVDETNAPYILLLVCEKS
jgi:hypothetical protein